VAKIFLSHAHVDAKQARWLAKELRHRFGMEFVEVEIFSTSDSKYRFRSPLEAFTAGQSLAESLRRCGDELRNYLYENMSESVAYLLLLTPRSTSVSHAWVRWEISEAGRLAAERRKLFVPCLLGVEWKALQAIATAPAGSKWGEFEVGVPVPDSALHPEHFQAINLDEPKALDRLTEALILRLRQDVPPSSNETSNGA
jgi:hypothetical protein